MPQCLVVQCSGAQEGKVDTDMKTKFEPTEAGSGSLLMLFSLL